MFLFAYQLTSFSHGAVEWGFRVSRGNVITASLAHTVTCPVKSWCNMKNILCLIFEVLLQLRICAFPRFFLRFGALNRCSVLSFMHIINGIMPNNDFLITENVISHDKQNIRSGGMGARTPMEIIRIRYDKCPNSLTHTLKIQKNVSYKINVPWFSF